MGQIVLHTMVAVAAIILFVRLNGLRSFSKMAGFDFALTIASGSILASVMTSEKTPWPGLVALATLFVLRFAISKTRVLSRLFEGLIDNGPVFLMYGGEILEENLIATRVSKADLMGKLREANALDISEVHAVVLEATGDVSVLHGSDVSEGLLENVSWGRATPPRPA